MMASANNSSDSIEGNNRSGSERLLYLNIVNNHSQTPSAGVNQPVSIWFYEGSATWY